MGSSQSRSTNNILTNAIRTKNIKSMKASLPIFLKSFDFEKEIYKEIFKHHDPLFLTKTIEIGYPIAKLPDIFHLYLSTITPDTPNTVILQIMTILKEKGADPSYLSEDMFRPLDYVKHVVKTNISKDEIVRFLKNDMISKGINPDEEETYEQTPIRLLAKKYEDQIPMTSFNTSKWIGTLCDSLGFFQHYGECWNDAVQMAVLYTDGLKELTQPFFYFPTITREYIESIPQFKYESDIIIDLALVYLNSLQRRFRRHYNLEVQRRAKIQNLSQINDLITADIKCSPEIMKEKQSVLDTIKMLTELKNRLPYIDKSIYEPYIQQIATYNKTVNIIKPYINTKIRHDILKTLEESGKSYQEMNTLQGAVSGMYLSKTNHLQNNMAIHTIKSKYKTRTGGNQIHMLEYLLPLCGISINDNSKTSISLYNTILNNKITEENKFYLSIFVMEKINVITPSIISNHIHKTTNAILVSNQQSMFEGHVNLFYQCGNKQYFYEDNTGPIPFQWKQFFSPSTWTSLFPETTEDEYWKDIEIHTCSLMITYPTGDFIHLYYRIIQFKIVSPVNPCPFYTLQPGSTDILYPIHSKSSDGRNIYSTNISSIAVIREVKDGKEKETPYYKYSFITVPEDISILPNVQSDVPFLPSAIRTVPKKRKATRKSGGRMNRKTYRRIK